jgi:hypothetical protein
MEMGWFSQKKSKKPVQISSVYPLFKKTNLITITELIIKLALLIYQMPFFGGYKNLLLYIKMMQLGA